MEEIVREIALFDDPNGDLILRSSDQVKFRTYKAFLSTTSPMFEIMMKLPQNSQEDEAQMALVDMSEKSHELQELLLWCDPRGRPSMELKDLASVLLVAEKYDMQCIIDRVGDRMREASETTQKHCLSVYAIAYRFRFRKLAEDAARYSLNVPLDEWVPVPEMDLTTGTAIQLLLVYRFDCVRAVQQYLISSTRDLLRENCESLFDDYHSSCGQARFQGFDLPRWLAHYLQRVKEQLYVTPTGSAASCSDLVDPAQESMKACKPCKEKLLDFLGFKEKLSNELTRAVQAVPVNLPFANSVGDATNIEKAFDCLYYS